MLNQIYITMKKLFLMLSTALMFAFAGCESLGDDNVVGGSYSISGAIQKGPFVQGSIITIQPLNSNLKPIGQMYTTQTTNDAGMFEMEGVNSKYAEIIATGYYYDEVEGKISASPLTLRSIADLKDGAQTNVNLLTSLTYNRIKNLVTNDGKGISEAQEQAEKELYTALDIPENLHPSVSCGAMNIANNGEGDGLLLVISAILQEGRTTGELTEYISKFATDLADDGQVAQTLLDKFNLDGQHLLRFEGRIKDNLKARYESLGIECNVPEFSQYLSYLGKPSEHFIIPFTYYEERVTPNVVYEGIEKLNFGADVDYIGYAYQSCYGEIYLSAAPTVIHTCQCDVLRTIEIPNSVKEISAYAFSGCISLESITIPNGLTEIGSRTFHCCSSLKSIDIPEGVTVIRDNAFSGCWSLESVTIPNSVTSIEESAFSFCESLTNITIPDSVTQIYSQAFFGCLNLQSVTVGEGFVPHGVRIFSSCPNLAEFKGIFASKDGRCLVWWGGDLVAFAPAGLTEYTIPESISTIGSDAFADCDYLEHITIPESVTTIGTDAFAGCDSLTSVTIPNSVTNIDELAFWGCRKLTNINIPEGVERIGQWAFASCESLDKITLPSTLTSVERGAFAQCVALVSVYCKPTTPPSITLSNGIWEAFICDDLLSAIYVPTESVEAYKAAEGWNEYSDYIVGYDFE